jgi:hypothetical protein
MDVTDGARRGLRTVVGLCVVIVVAAVTMMLAFVTDLPEIAIAIGPVAVVAALAMGRLAQWRAIVDRRRLRRRVGDPLTLSGQWRRQLAAAWAARDEFAAAIVAHGASPIGERLADHQMVMDAALERCGELARRGHRMHGQLRAFRSTRLRRDLLIERHRDRHGERAAALARRLDDVARLRAELDRINLQLEEQVHDMRTAAWHASTLRLEDADEPEVALTTLHDELAHLRAALREVDRPRAAAAS